MANGRKPLLYMIGGPNGGGKTSVAMGLMPAPIGCYEYVNADSIAAALSPFRPSEVSIEAGRLMIKRIHELAVKRQDFAFETTMASRSFVSFLKECGRVGYSVNLVYIWLESPELAMARVAQRVASGGHFVAEETVRSRYARGLHNFFSIYVPIADSWAFYDNSEGPVGLVARKTRGSRIQVVQSQTWGCIQEHKTW
jgi:predicted ABC-type ATPase